MSDIAALSVEGISHAYGARTALHNASFALPPACFTALLGLNGAGKSTLFALITRLYPVRTGRIRIFGHDATREPGAALRQLGVVFQARTLDLDLSVAQNLAYHAALHGIAPRQAARLAAEALARIGLHERAGEKVRALSGGQMRRVEIARALMHGPRLLLLDEPTVGLDIKARADILAHVRMLVRERGVAVLWATHLVDEVADDDALIVLHQGRILADGPVPRVLAQADGTTVRDAFTRLTERARDDVA
ncbi:MAG: ATP-binding cassette domain-containing protein [Alphaproteobacteria bacterium]|nr:ATP-binding cassette domain-containing protein [Alphaproteobacteria bacterium]